MAGPPIILRAKPLDALDDFHNEVRKKRRLQDVPLVFERHELWEREARRRFGEIKYAWRFRCHHCKTVFSVADYVAIKAPAQAIGFACLGAFLPDAQLACNYNGTNLQPGNPVTVHMPGGVVSRMLSFAD